MDNIWHANEKDCVGHEPFDGGTMRIYDYSEIEQNLLTMLTAALKEEVIITGPDGRRFKLISVNEDKKELKSPLENIKSIDTNITMPEIREAIKQGREDRE
jgi:hypothetical protein